MSEAGYVERPILEWLSGFGSTDPGERGLGWTYRDAVAMEAFGRPIEDPIVEALLVPAVRRINPDVKTDDQARMAVDVLRRAMATPDRLEANRLTLDLLRDGVTLVLEPGRPASTVKIVECDPSRQPLNDFTATNQYRVQGVRECRDDTVLLVNGIPLVVAEYKSYVTGRKDWREAVKQLHRYQRQAPLMLAPNVFCIAADEQEFRYGTVLFHDASGDDIKQHLDAWGPWLSLYPERRGYWNERGAGEDEDKLRTATRGLLRVSPCHLLDFLRHFVAFETKRGRTTKKIARYQQFEAANDIVDRTVGLHGKDADPQDRTGLVWHTQGSGKSLTMLFAAYKLRHHAALDNPTVLIVVDRRDLKTQLADDFEACDYPGVVKALGVEDLKARLRADRPETIITTIQAFQRMDDLPPRDRDNIICLIDEAHRSQKGDGAGFAMTLRVKLPRAFRFGLTGTPIDRTMVNTHRDFGPRRDGVQERYLSYYGIRRAIKDGATLPVHYVRDRVPLAVDEEPLSVGFEQMADEAELSDEEAKDFIQRAEARWLKLTKDPCRVGIVVKKLLDHFLAYPDPNGFKAQLVVVDRKACALYKTALDQKLRERNLPPEWSDVVISEGQNDTAELTRFHYGKTHTDDLIEYFKLTPAQWEAWNRERHGDDRAKWRPPLKILVVCDRLLTGFDAPVEQVLYLDKPLRDHNLLQAMARTNRPMPLMGKRHGLIVDYFGVFEDLQKALNFDESDREEALIDWDALKNLVPEEVAGCLSLFAGIAIEDTRDCLLSALRRLRDPDAARAFEEQFRRLETLWEAVSPDPCLYDHRHVYRWLCSIYVAHRRRQSGSQVTYEELSAKTRQLIRDNTTFIETAEALPVYRIDANYLTKLGALPSPADQAAALEAMLTRELREGDDGFLYRQLGERLQRIKDQRDASDAAAEQHLRELTAMAEELNASRAEPERLGLTEPGEHGLFTVLRTYSKVDDEALVARAAKEMLADLRRNRHLPPGWSDTKSGRDRISTSLLVLSWRPEFESLCLGADADPPFLKDAVEELAKGDR